MYDYVDRPVASLPDPDSFILSAMRGWVAAARSGRCTCAVLGRGFEARAIPEALKDFAIAMATLDRDGCAKLGFGPVSAPTVTDDEARLLALFAMGRDGSAAQRARAAAVLVEEHAVGRLQRAISLVGDAMTGDAA